MNIDGDEYVKQHPSMAQNTRFEQYAIISSEIGSDTSIDIYFNEKHAFSNGGLVLDRNLCYDGIDDMKIYNATYATLWINDNFYINFVENDGVYVLYTSCPLMHRFLIYCDLEIRSDGSHAEYKSIFIMPFSRNRAEYYCEIIEFQNDLELVRVFYDENHRNTFYRNRIEHA